MTITPTLRGGGYVNGLVPKLVKAGQGDIVGSAVSVAGDGTSLTTTFDLRGKATGLWDVVVTNPDGGRATLPGGFNVRESGTWTPVSSPTINRTQHGAAVGPDGRVYAIGGNATVLGGGYLDAVDAYDPPNNRWTSVAPLPTARVALAVVASNGRIYAIGGARNGFEPLNVVEAYDPGTDTWSVPLPMSTQRSWLAAAAGHDGRVYAMGGDNGFHALYTTVEAYDPSANRWSTVQPMLVARRYFAAATDLDGRIYAIGGSIRPPNGVLMSSALVERYDPSTNQWTSVAPMLSARQGHAATLGLDGRIYVSGGFNDGIAYFDTVEAYDPRTDTWEAVPSLANIRVDHAMVTGLDGRIYAIGGGTAENPQPYPVEAYGVNRSGLGLTVSGPTALTISGGQYTPNPFSLVATVTNNGSTTAQNVQATISLPPGLSLTTGGLQQAIGDLASGQQKQVTWSVQAAGQTQQATLSWSVTVASSNTGGETKGGQITVPGGAVTLTSVSPAVGGDTGNVTVTLHGGGFLPGMAVKLVKAGQPAIVGTNVNVASEGTSAQATFDLTAGTSGRRDVVVTNPGSAGATLTGAFTVEAGVTPEVWVDVLGPDVARTGRTGTFYVVYGNLGNTDAYDTTLFIKLNGQLLLPMWIPSITATSTVLTPISVTIPDGIFEVTVELWKPDESDFTDSGYDQYIFGMSRTYSLVYLARDPSEYELDYRNKSLEHVNHIQITERGLPSGLNLPSDNVDCIGEGYNLTPSQGHRRHEGQDITVLFDSDVKSIKDGTVVFAAEYPAYGKMVQILTDGSTNEYIMYAHLNSIKVSKGSKVKSGQVIGTAGLTGNATARQGFGVLHLEYRTRGWPDFEPTGPSSPPEGEPLLQNPKTRLPEIFSTLGEQNKRDCFKKGRATKTKKSAGVGSFDPNDKFGPPGVGPSHLIRAGNSPAAYEVLFENTPSATAPAQDVVVTDQLDSTKVDLSTFTLGPIVFGSRTITPPSELSQWSTDVDLRQGANPSNLIVRINAGVNMTTGLATWRFQSLDPATMLPTEDALAGFLPPNVTSPQGEGSVLFTISPKPGLATGTEIRNKARIIFDTNAPIDTPEWLNTIDASKPTSQVQALSATQTSASFTVNWSGSDQGAGIGDYTIYVSENGGPYTVWLANTTATSGTFTGQDGKTYGFYSVARDAANNPEDVPASPDATTRVQLPPTMYSLTVTRAGTGIGTVTATGITCGTTCSASFAGGTQVTLTAAPATGNEISTFAGWQGACAQFTQSLTCTLTMTKNETVVAVFQRNNVGVGVGRQPTRLPNGDWQLVASLAARAGCGTIDHIQFGATGVPFANARVSIISPSGGPSGRTSGFDYKPPAGTTTVVLTFERVVTSGSATVNPILFTDGCGTWQTFVGGGPNAFR